MNSYIDFLQNHSSYEITKNTLVLPNVTYCRDNLDLHYTKVISINGATITCDSATYDGTTHIAENILVVVNGVTLTNGVDYEVAGNEGWINTGTYSFTIKGLNANYKGLAIGSFTINKASGSVTTSPIANNLIYNTQAQALVTAGSGTGDIRYKLDEGEWSDSIPTTINAGTYIVSYKVLESSNYLESSVGSVSVTVDKITPTVTAPTAKTLTYNTSAQTLINEGSTNFGTILYSLDGSDYSTTAPEGTDYGTYTVYYRVDGDSNINNVAAKSISVSITKANQSAPTATGATVNYGSTATATASGGGGQGSLEWSNGNTRTAVGSQSTSARWGGNGNYNASSWSNSVTLTVNDPYNGHAYVDLGLPSGTKWATLDIGSNNEEISSGEQYQYGGTTRFVDESDPYVTYSGTENPLPASYDVATQRWGGSWHIPTRVQWEELFTNCNISLSSTYKWGEDYYYIKLTSKKNNNVIKFPVNSYCEYENWGLEWHDSYEESDDYSWYMATRWTSTPQVGDDRFYAFMEESYDKSEGDTDYYKGTTVGHYYSAYPIRPVVG